MRIPLLILLATSTLNAAEADIRGYLDTHCFDCHDSTTKKGGLDLESLPMQFDQVERFSAWAHVHDRIAAGEMPPKSRRDRPSEKESADALKLLDDRLHEADAAHIAKTGRALFRRLLEEVINAGDVMPELIVNTGPSSIVTLPSKLLTSRPLVKTAVIRQLGP